MSVLIWTYPATVLALSFLWAKHANRQVKNIVVKLNECLTYFAPEVKRCTNYTNKWTTLKLCLWKPWTCLTFKSLGKTDLAVLWTLRSLDISVKQNVHLPSCKNVERHNECIHSQSRLQIWWSTSVHEQICIWMPGFVSSAQVALYLAYGVDVQGQFFPTTRKGWVHNLISLVGYELYCCVWSF